MVSILCNICCIIIKIHGYCSLFESAAFGAFCFLKVFGFYTLGQEPHCVREHFLIIIFRLLLCISVTPFTCFSPFVVSEPVITRICIKSSETAKHCKKKKTKQHERLYLFLYRVSRLIFLVRQFRLC